MADDKFPASGSHLKTVNDQGDAPKARITEFLPALNLVESLRRSSEERNRKAASIKGMFDGNPPYNPAKLRANGMAYYPNFSTLEGKAYLGSAKVPYYDLFSNVPHHIEVSLDIPAPEIADEWSRIVTEELHRTVSDASWFEMTMWKMLTDFVGFGRGFLIWPDKTDWKFRRVAWHRVLFPDDTDVDMDEWESFAILWHYNAHDLYKRVRNKQKAESAGWNTDNVIKAIQMAARYDPGQLHDWMGIQRQLRDNDLYADLQCDKIITAWLFVKEFDGKWSQMILPMTQLMDPAGKKVRREQAGFLYRRIGLYDNIRQIIAPFFFEVDDGSINGLSGLGKDIFAPMQVKDRMACAKTNNVFMRSSVLMQARSATGRQKAALSQIGNVTIIPEGYEVQQSTILGDIESTIAVGRDLDLMLQSNTGIYRPQFEKPSGNPETATAAQLRFTQGTILGNSAVNRFHKQLDACYDEMYRRIIKASDTAARSFRSWVEERGVPSQALSRIRSVRSYRNIGNGSAFLRQNNIASLATFFNEFPEDGKRKFIEDVVAAFTNQQKVERYVATSQRDNIPTRHVWEATQENAALKEGAPVVWVPDQDDIIHLTIHAQALQQAIEGVGQGADPAAVVVFGQGVLNHVGSTHLQSLQRKQRKEQVRQWTEVYTELGGAIEQIVAQIQKSQDAASRQAARTEQVMDDAELDNFTAQRKLEIQEMKTRHQMSLREAQAAQKMQLGVAQVAQKMEINDAQAASKIIREQQNQSNKTAKDRNGS